MRRLSWKRLVLAAVALVLAAVVSAGPAWAEKKLVFTAGADFKSLDPALHPSGTFDGLVQVAPYDTLVFQAPDGSIKPSLATSWTYKSPTRIVFKLRKGVKYHDGTTFKAADVKFNLERVLNMKRSRWKTFINMIKVVNVIDDSTVEIELKFPFGPFLANLAIPVASIASPAGIKKYGKNFRRNPVGTGPFILDKWVPGEYARFKANPNYWGGRPKIDVLEFRPIPEASTRVLQLRAGQVQLAMFLPPAQMGEVDKDPKLDMLKTPLFRVIFVGMNNEIKPFDNPLVRQAVNYAVDVDAIVGKVMLGVGKPIRGVYGPAVWGYDPKFEKMGYSYNPAKAKALLKKAGYPNGFDTDFWHPTGKYTADKVAAEAIQAQLAKVGIRVRLRTGGWGLVAPTIRKGKAPIYFYGWGALTGDPDIIMYNKFHSKNHGRKGNYSRYTNPKVDKLIEQARMETDSAKRKKMYFELSRMILKDAPWLFFKQEVMLVGKSKKLKGVIFHPSERIYFHKAWLED
jgi:peptide/nickel transport system substrate-binding protein